MTTAEVANQLVQLCRNGKYVEAVETLYADNVSSVEAMEFGDIPRDMHGKEAVKGKNLWWLEHNEVHGVSVDGPFVSPERFAVMFTFDHTNRDSGERRQFKEVGVDTVIDGKIAREEFLYAGES